MIDEKISAGYEMVPSPQARVYTIESDPSMSMISSGDESWEHVDDEEKDKEGSENGAGLIVEDKKDYAEILKQPSPRRPPRTIPDEHQP